MPDPISFPTAATALSVRPKPSAFYAGAGAAVVGALVFAGVVASLFGGWPTEGFDPAATDSAHASGRPVASGKRVLKQGVTFAVDCDRVAESNIDDLFPRPV